VGTARVRCTQRRRLLASGPLVGRQIGEKRPGPLPQTLATPTSLHDAASPVYGKEGAAINTTGVGIDESIRISPFDVILSSLERTTPALLRLGFAAMFYAYFYKNVQYMLFAAVRTRTLSTTLAEMERE